MRTILVLLASLLALTSCASGPVSPPAESPHPGVSESTAEPTDAPSTPPATAEPQPALIVQALDLSLIGDPDLVTTTNNSPAYYGSWFDTGAQKLNDTLAKYVKDSTQRWADQQGEIDALDKDVEAIPELNVQSELTAAGKDVVGIRVVSQEFAGASTGSSYRTFWFDAEQGSVGGSDKLFTDEGLAPALKAITEALEKHPSTFPEAVKEIAAPGEREAFLGAALDSINFAPDGSLIVEFDDYVVAPGVVSPMQIKLEAGLIEDWLSDLGRRAQRAAKRPEMPELNGSTKPTDPSVTPSQPKQTEPSAPETTPETTEPVTPPSGDRPDCVKLKCVALTFDDGPGQHTGKLLDALKAEKVPATFYVVGPNVDSHPGAVRRMFAEGHQVGNHSWTHRQMTALSADEMLKEMRDTDAAVERAAGHRTSTMRPPYGAINADVRAAMAKYSTGQIITWSVDTLDWKTRNAEATLESVRNDTKSGSIILMHDIHAETVQAVPQVIRHLKQQGYTLVTVNDLLAPEKPQPGKVYSKLG